MAQLHVKNDRLSTVPEYNNQINKFIISGLRCRKISINCNTIRDYIVYLKASIKTNFCNKSHCLRVYTTKTLKLVATLIEKMIMWGRCIGRG